jgi:hypothetical protein
MAPSEELPLERLLRDAAPTLSLEERDRVMLECGRRVAMRGKVGVGIVSSLATAASLLGWVALWRPITADVVAKIDRTASLDVSEASSPWPDRSAGGRRVTASRSIVDGVWTAAFRPTTLAALEVRLRQAEGPAQDAADSSITSGRILKATDRDLPDWL